MEINLPDWAENQNLYIYAGIELVAYKYVGKDLKIKTSRCNQCGDCCRNIKGDNPPQTDGICDHLRGDICSLGMGRPFSCGLPNQKFECAEVFK